MPVSDKTTVQEALQMIDACFDVLLLFHLAAELADRFQGQDDLMVYLSEYSVVRLRELKEAEPQEPDEYLPLMRHRGPIGFA